MYADCRKNYETHSFFNCLSSLPYQNTSSYKFIMCTNTHTFNCNINNLLLYYTAYFPYKQFQLHNLLDRLSFNNF